MTKHYPTEITLHKAKHLLELTFDDGNSFKLPTEYLRVYSPSAEVQGHGPDDAVLQLGKEDVNIDKIEQVGTYALQLTFDDGHDTGIYAWDTLYDLGVNYVKYWQDYLDRLEKAGHKRKQPDHH